MSETVSFDSVEVELTLVCDSCGDELDLSQHRGQIKVTPCTSCLASERAEGDTEGYERGLEEGESKSE